MNKITRAIVLGLAALSMSPVLRYASSIQAAGLRQTAGLRPRAELMQQAEQTIPKKDKGMLNGFFIKFFEEQVAKKPVVSKYTNEELGRMADEHKVDFYKLRTMLVVQELLNLKGESKELSEIKNMKDAEMRKLIYEAKSKYYDPLSKGEKEQLEKEYKEWKKSR